MARYRITYGFVQDIYLGFGCVKAPTFREDWWWVCDDLPEDDSYPYDPEGPFLTKQAARRHLFLHLSSRDQAFRGWAKTVILHRRKTLRPAIKHVMLWKKVTRKEIQERAK